MSARLSIVAALSGLALAGMLVAPMASAAPAPPTLQEHLDFLRSHSRGGTVAEPQRARAHFVGDDFDVLDYTLDIEVLPDLEAIAGSVQVTLTPSPGVNNLLLLEFDCDSALEVLGVTRGTLQGPALPFFRLGESVRIGLDVGLPQGSQEVITIRFQGLPRQDDGVGLVFSTHGASPNIYTLGEPHHAHLWWPCKDRPDDKATLTLAVTVPEPLVVIGNGHLMDVTPISIGTRRYTWREAEPIATYVAGFAAGDYESCASVYESPLDASIRVPMTTWAWSDALTQACSRSQSVPAAMRSFAQRFGEYPFVDDKYDQVIVEAPMGIDPSLAMENQTASIFGARLILTSTDSVMAHELAHQWWGNSVTPRGFDDIWLNEGWATWSEALAWESRNGTTEYLGFMRQLDTLRQIGEFEGTVENPTDADGNGWPDGVDSGPVATVYFKGAWVMHMLRYVVSPPGAPGSADNVEQILRAHALLNRGTSVTTQQFVDLADTMATQQLGMNDGLRWFFDEWLNRTDRPCYAVGWSAAPQSGGGYRVFLDVEQREWGMDPDLERLACATPLPQPYRMPVIVKLHMPDGSVQDTMVDNRQGLTRYEFMTTVPPTSVTWDEPGWILKGFRPIDIDADDDGWPDDLDGCWLVANPLQEDTDQDGVQDACEPDLDWDQDGVLNASDCAPNDPTLSHGPDPQGDPAQDPMLHAMREGTGMRLEWRLPAGVPGAPDSVVDVMQGRLERLHVNRGFDDGRCVVTGTTTTSIVLPAAQVTGNRWFVATPWNGCGETGPDGSVISACR